MLSTIALDTQVIQPGLCTGCGACQGMCPYWDSVEGRTICYFDCERPDGRCQRFCPRMPTDLDALRKQFFPAETILPEIGPFLGLYLTRAADASLRAGAQHGGTMTALVELALKEGFIDAAALTRSRGGLEPEGVLATTAEEVRSCSGSSFQIPPTLAVLNRALREDRYHAIGVVGTPCKTLAAYKMKAQPFAEDGNHAENIGMVFGLFCGWGLDWEGLRDLTAKHAAFNWKIFFQVGHLEDVVRFLHFCILIFCHTQFSSDSTVRKRPPFRDVRPSASRPPDGLRTGSS